MHICTDWYGVHAASTLVCSMIQITSQYYYLLCVISDGLGRSHAYTYILTSMVCMQLRHSSVPWAMHLFLWSYIVVVFFILVSVLHAVHGHVCMYIYIYVCMYVCMYLFLWSYIVVVFFILVSLLCMYVCMYVCALAIFLRLLA